MLPPMYPISCLLYTVHSLLLDMTKLPDALAGIKILKIIQSEVFRETGPKKYHTVCCPIPWQEGTESITVSFSK